MKTMPESSPTRSRCWGKDRLRLKQEFSMSPCSTESSLSSCSTIDNDSSSNGTRRRQVTFDSVDIVELGMVLGNHPACRQGPPVRISDSVQRRHSMDIDDYEQQRLSHRRSRRDLHLSSTERLRLISLEDRDSDIDDDDDSSSSPSLLTNGDFSLKRNIPEVNIEDTLCRLDAVNSHMNEMLDRMCALEDGFELRSARRRQRRHHHHHQQRQRQRQRRQGRLG